jgi:type IV secretion system protein VirB11
MLNPDGRIWIDRLTDGLENTGEWLAPADGERIIRLVAHHVGAEVHPGSPRVSAELPETGERFEGLLAAHCRCARLRHPQAGGLHIHARRLRRRRNHAARAGE